MLKNLDRRLREETGLPVQLAEAPLSSVVLGTGKMLSDFNLLRRISLDYSVFHLSVATRLSAAVVPADCVRDRAPGSRPSLVPFAPATTTIFFESHPITACTDTADSSTTDHEGVSRREESLRPTSGHGLHRRA